MGFKCPVCFKDFKQNKKEWEKHCKEYHKGCAKDIVNLTTKIAEEE